MSEITREQIERALQTKIEDDRVWIGGPVAVRLTGLLALALKGLDHAADARLGARAREALVSCGLSDPRFLERVALELRAPTPANAGHPWAHHSALADVVETFAKTLREEQADAVRGEGR